MWLLLLCLRILCSAQQPDYPDYPVPAEGSISLPCGYYSTSPVPLVMKLQMEMSNNKSLVVVGMSPLILTLDTNVPRLQIPSSGKEKTSSRYSCSVNHTAHRIELTDKSGDVEWITCRAPDNWTLLQWFRDGNAIAVVERAEVWLNVVVERKESSSFLITSCIKEDSANCSDLGESVTKTLNVTCQWLTLPNSPSGWQLFVERKYWIIVVVSLSSALVSSMLAGCFVSIKRGRRARRQAKRSGFFKVSTAARNLYTDSITQDTDATHKDQDFTYQNVSLSPTKGISDDCYSDKGSFLSVGGDSYLEPIADGGDKMSDGDCYEDPIQDQDDHEDSLDGDCYENANEEIKDGSEGSQSYEDMKGSICVRTKSEAPPDEGITQDEDADSYENMQTPLYSQPNRPCNPPHKSTEDQTEGRKASPTEPPTHQHPRKVATQLQEQNGDFYFSYETNKL